MPLSCRQMTLNLKLMFDKSLIKTTSSSIMVFIDCMLLLKIVKLFVLRSANSLNLV